MSKRYRSDAKVPEKLKKTVRNVYFRAVSPPIPVEGKDILR